jgi:hypothetical protein
MVWIISPILKIGTDQHIGQTIVRLPWDADYAISPGNALDLPEGVFWMVQVLQNFIAEYEIVGAIRYGHMNSICL